MTPFEIYVNLIITLIFRSYLKFDQLLRNTFFQRSNMMSYEINWRVSRLINEPNWIIYYIIRLAKKHIYISIIKGIIFQNACVYLQIPNVDFLQQTVSFCITLILCYLRLWVWIRIKWVVKLSLINQLIWALQSSINWDVPIQRDLYERDTLILFNLTIL